MDSSGMIPRKPRSKSSCYDDRLSPLPDDILHCILSSVDCLDVVRTCVLSKRWQHVWMSVPCLNFNMDWFLDRTSTTFYEEFEQRCKFWDFIKWVLLLRDESRIRRICLSADDTMIHHLHGLLLVAARRKVLELCIKDGDYAFEELQFPRALCETLTFLTMDFRHDILMRPTTAFRNLRSLYLRGIIITSAIIEKLLSIDCIGLEDVHLEACKVTGVKLISISARNLKNLTIVNVFCVHLWAVSSFDYVLNIYAPNLESFVYIGPMLRGFAFLNTVSVRKALIRIVRSPQGYEDEWGHLNLVPSPTKFIGLTHVTSLTLSSLIVKRFSPTYGNPSENNFILENLSCLKLGLRYNVECIKGMINLLRRSPNLEDLVIIFKERHLLSRSKRNTRTGGSQTSWAEDIFCPLHHLKTIHISYYDGTELALGVVKFLLENGKILEKIEIMSRSKGSKRHTYNELVALLPRTATNVVISVPEYSQVLLPWFAIGDSDTEED